MVLKAPNGELLKYDVLHVFPFSSETKRMGIIVRERATGQIVFYMKGTSLNLKRICFM